MASSDDYMMSAELQKQWLDACISIGIPAVTTDTAARVFAILLVHGGENEDFTQNVKFTNEAKYIQGRFCINGGETPDAGFVERLQGYVKELEKCQICNQPVPEWAVKLMKERYGIKIR